MGKHKGNVGDDRRKGQWRGEKCWCDCITSCRPIPFLPSLGVGLARCFTAGRCCVVRVIGLSCASGKAVPAPLSAGRACEGARTGTTPPVVVPRTFTCTTYGLCGEPSATQHGARSPPAP